AVSLVAADDADGGPGRTIVSSHMARTSPGFMDIVANSPAAEIAARLMVVPDVRYLYDQLFIKEPGTTAPTDWHHDLPFWPFDGNDIASVWIALTPVNRDNSGLVYVAGSHKWNTLYRPDPAPPRQNFLKGGSGDLPPCPAFHKEFDNPEYRFVSWDMEPGDCLVHHPLTVHGAGPNASLEQRRVALSIRYFGGDAKWAAPRTSFTVPGTEHEVGLERGAFPANEDVFPVIWRRADAPGSPE
ncbi:MAG: phytanoyl-CoA dioxygenase family protein, partial [Alphaproteobacteria bacterium]|nr:phytanoyl-CoA dioxygenase family protein [Alphaproteobacteria bacterium]